MTDQGAVASIKSTRKETTVMFRKVTLALIGLVLSAGAACGGSTTAGTSTPTPVSATPSSQQTPSSQPTSVATTTDPCQVVTVSDASTLTGVSYGPGREETTSGGGKICIYGYQTLNVFEVLVGVAPSAASAQAQWASEESTAQAALNKAFTQVPGLKVSLNAGDVTIAGADKAAIATSSATYSGHAFNAAAVYLLKGPIFLTFSDLVLDHPAPSTSAMEKEAQTALGNLP
jgi:hypothetical protein